MNETDRSASPFHKLFRRAAKALRSDEATPSTDKGAEPNSALEPADLDSPVEAGADRTVSVVDLDSWDEDGDIVHEVLKKTDVWFSFRASALEEEAKALAASHAEKGQPRHDLERDGPLEMELLLERQACEALSGWADRVKRKMQGAIASETERVGEGLATVRQAIANAEAAKEAIGRHVRSTAVRAVDLRNQLQGWREKELNPGLPAETIESERHLKNAGFWLLMVLLVLADFFANLPVFTELFPANQAVDTAFQSWEDEHISRGEGISTNFGIMHLLMRVAIYPEPAILALSVVVFFLFLGHELGGALRTSLLLWLHRRKDGITRIRDEFRQTVGPALISLLGILLTVWVLYLARDMVLPRAEARLETARSELESIELRRNELMLEGQPVSPDFLLESAAAQENVRSRQLRREYAEAIDGMNWPITLLNLVLVIVAVIAGYMRQSRTFTVGASAERAVADEARRRGDAAREELDEISAIRESLRATFIQRRQDAHETLRKVGTSLLRTEHLLDVDLLRDLYGKTERLRRAVPLFRTENARLRGLDVDDIVAFRTDFEMNLPGRDELSAKVERPPALTASRAEYEDLRARLRELDREDPSELPPTFEVRFKPQIIAEPVEQAL